MVGEALATLLSLEEGFFVVGVAAAGDAVLKLVANEQPHVTLMDLELAHGDAIDLIREIVARDPEAQVAVMSMHDDRQTVLLTLEAGAVGFFPKSATRAELLGGLRAVAAGWGYLHPSVTRPALARIRGPREPTGPESLTEQERHVLEALADGLATQEIAEALHISAETVKTHLRHVFQKLGVNDRVQAVVAAFRSGLVT